MGSSHGLFFVREIGSEVSLEKRIILSGNAAKAKVPFKDFIKDWSVFKGDLPFEVDMDVVKAHMPFETEQVIVALRKRASRCLASPRRMLQSMPSWSASR